MPVTLGNGKLIGKKFVNRFYFFFYEMEERIEPEKNSDYLHA